MKQKKFLTNLFELLGEFYKENYPDKLNFPDFMRWVRARKLQSDEKEDQ